MAKWLARSPEAVTLATSLQPLQIAFAKGSPCEVSALAFSEAARDLDASSGLLQIDMANAFNTISRRVVLEEIAGSCPSLLPWVRASFQPTPLFCGK